MQIVEVSKAHKREELDCGVTALNDYLRHSARQHGSRDISRTYILAASDDPGKIVGYYTITFADVKAPPGSKLSAYPHPLASMKIARLAVDLQYRGQRTGETLLLSALEKACNAYQVAPIVGVFVDAKDDVAKSFYFDYGFDVANDSVDEFCLWLPIGTCIKLFE